VHKFGGMAAAVMERDKSTAFLHGSVVVAAGVLKASHSQETMRRW
jgi:hypothetical protein